MPKRNKGPFAVIDLGSNSIRLVVYDGVTRAPITRFNERRLCGLGRGVARNNKLGRAGKTCALDSLKRFTAIASGLGCDSIDIIATAAIRQAEDGKAFVARASKIVRQPITVLSGAQEAHFGALGVTCGFFQPRGIMGDLGGGSVEFGCVPASKRLPEDNSRLRSLPLGTLIVGEALKAGGLEQAMQLIDAEFAKYPDLEGLAKGETFYVVGGSWRALARSRMTVIDHPLRIVHGFELSPDEAIELGQSMLEAEDINAMPGLPRKRVETAPAAGLMLSQAVKRLAPAKVVFSATGVREGRLYAQLKRQERHRDPLLAAAGDLGALANRDPSIGPAMVEWTNGLFEANETATQRRLREAICHISDSSWREHPDSRAREAFLRLVQYPFFGINHAERISLAYGVYFRYGGSRSNLDIRRMLDVVQQDCITHIEALGLVLELGYRLSGGATEILARCSIHRHDGAIRLRTHHDAIIEDDDAILARLNAIGRAFGTDMIVIDNR